MFTTAPLFGKFHSPQAPADHLAQARAALHAHTLPQLHDIAAAFLPDACLAPKAAGLHSRQRIYSDVEREAWLKLSEESLMKTWDNAEDDIFNELLAK